MAVNVIIAGVGGQGSIMASRIIADAVLSEGSDNRKVRVGETFGAAMRGGAVSSHVRIGDVEGPLVPEDGCDLIIGLEPLEALRLAVKYLAPGGIVVLNTEKNLPTDVKVGMAVYPEIAKVEDAIKALDGKVVSLDASELASKAGSMRSVNVVMLGAAFGTGILPASKDAIIRAISGRVPPRTVDTNLKAFSAGLEAAAR